MTVTKAEWDAALPDVIRRCASRWGLTLGEPFDPGAGGYAVPAKTGEDTHAVLKIAFPHRESEYEPDALAVWGGDGAVRLFDRDDALHAMLIEQCIPGSSLSQAGLDDPLGVLISLLPRLWRTVGEPFRPLADEARWWVSYLEDRWEEFGRPFERRLLGAARTFLIELSTSQGEQVLVHQDLHGDNVLAAQREPWLVIDPKPLRGERAFALAPIIRSSELGHSRDAVLRRLDRLTAELDIDRERARGWAVGQTIAWSFDTTYIEDHTEIARWLLQ